MSARKCCISLPAHAYHAFARCREAFCTVCVLSTCALLLLCTRPHLSSLLPHDSSQGLQQQLDSASGS
jgi:hypothetical protein